MNRFLLMWTGQLVSSLGSGITAFALAVSIYRHTGHVADLATIAIAVYLPHIIVAPFAGTLADRLDRRRLILVADIGSAIATLLLLAATTPTVAIVLVALSSTCNALQWPAYESAVVALVPPEQLDRANGLVELSRGASQLLAPLVAGSLLSAIGLRGILILDIVSFTIAIGAILSINIPAHRTRKPRRTFADLAEAWRLVAQRPGLIAMLVLFAITSFTFAVVDVALKPLVLAIGEPWQLGLVLSTVGVGMVVGSVTMTAWGGPRRRIVAILVFQLIEGGSLVVAGAHPQFGILVAAAFAYGLVIPLTFACARTLWQVTLPADIQGRVSALRNAAVMIAIPVGYAAAIPLASVFALHVLITLMGLVTCAAAVAAYTFRPYRELA